MYTGRASAESTTRSARATLQAHSRDEVIVPEERERANERASERELVQYSTVQQRSSREELPDADAQRRRRDTRRTTSELGN
jgi:hypothetical protein